MIEKFKVTDRIQFQNLLLKWFHKNKRNLPWRKTSNWYSIFLSEFMLQQTQVEQALPYYIKFITRFPDIYALSDASEQEILLLWAGLGYYSRARNMLKTAHILVNDFEAKFPNNFNQALSLPGVGKYTASAILSIAFKKPYAVVDGNVYRVITRIFAIENDIRLSDTQKQIQELSDKLLVKNNPGDYNEAIMELGSTICKKKDPDCEKCPLKIFCKAFEDNTQSEFPNKSAIPAKREVRHAVYIMNYKNTYLFVQRSPSGLLASFWEFPTLEMDKLSLEREILESQFQKYINISGKIVTIGNVFRHQYSHIDLSYIPILIKANQNIIKNIGTYVNYSWRALKNVDGLPIHNAHLKLIGWLKNLNQ